MIVFDLQCDGGHVFEGWFADSVAFAKQAKRRLVVCPACGSKHVGKAMMAPNISSPKKKKNPSGEPEPAATETAPTFDKAKEETAKYVKFLKTMRDHVEKNCDYVGSDFAEEARRIHYGETEKHNIYGDATPDEAARLNEEGI
ncbi:MAG: DUF1178 family protein, partial [Alphaproteobacteria bacterium]|nr:DUF1178 family protein [Alphaproteobacteria bacterium]